MANVLCVWEMGSNLGHLAQLKPFVDSALAHNHQVTLAAKELHNLNTLFKGYDIGLFQAPYHFRKPRRQFNPLLSYSQLVLQRFETLAELNTLYRAWQSIFEAVKPDVVIYDYAPSALIASLHRPWKKWVIGNGFFVPRSDLPYFGLFPGVKDSAENRKALAAADRRLLDITNGVLGIMDLPAISSPKEIIRQAQQELLLTLPELDHFGARKGVEYLGIPSAISGPKPRWPQNHELRAFGYLSNFKGIETLFDELLKQHVALNIYSRNIPAQIISKYPMIEFTSQLVSLTSVYEEADFVIGMGNHSTTVQSFLAGVPQLVIPMHQEQYYLARRIAAAKRGVLMSMSTESTEPAVTRVIEMAQAGKFPIDVAYKKAMAGALLKQRLDDLFVNA